MNGVRARRALAFALVGMSVVLTLAVIAYGARCGMRSTMAGCDADGCTTPTEVCEASVHPSFFALLAASVAAALAVSLRQPLVALATGVAMGVVGALSATGVLGLGLALLLSAAGAVATRRHPALVVAALVATALPTLLVEALFARALSAWSGTGKILAPPAWTVYLAAGAPATLWAAVALLSRQRNTS